MSSSLDGVAGLALNNGGTLTTINNSSGTTLMSSTSGDIDITAASGFKVNLSNTSISGPMVINGSPGTAGQVAVSQGPLLPAIWGAGSMTVANDVASNLTEYLTFARATSGSINTLYTANTEASFNPSTGKLTLANDASIHSITVGRGAGAIATNTAVGSSALAANAAGANNVAVGNNALSSNTSGSSNTAVGLNALADNTSGTQNTAIGTNALRDNTTGGNNTASGTNALPANTTGTDNTASGTSALFNNTTGDNNTASGRSALLANTTGNNNTAVGRGALLNNTTGSGNSAFNPMNSAGVYAPVFDPTTEDDRFCLGSTGVTNAYINISWTIVSDARDKTNIAPVPLGLDFVKQLEPVEYQRVDNREDMNAKGPVRYGFLAQDILAVEGDNPVIIDDEDPDHLKMNDSSLLSVMVNAIKELTARLEALEANNTAV